MRAVLDTGKHMCTNSDNSRRPFLSKLLASTFAVAPSNGDSLQMSVDYATVAGPSAREGVDYLLSGPAGGGSPERA